LQTLRTELLKAYVVKDYMDSRMPHHKFLIGAYMGPPTYSEQMVQDLIDANIDMVWRAGEACLERSEVGGDIKRAWDALNAAGIGMINELPFHTIRDGNGTLLDVLDYPNLWLVSGQDEPAVNRFDDLEALWDEVSPQFPECGYLNNLFPNYATISQLGTIYKSYLIDYVETVTTDIISYDHYPYGNPANRGLKQWLDNLAVVRDVCLEYGKDMYVAVQMASSNPAYGYVTTDQMRFQVNSSMCFGAKSITWFLWTNVTWDGAAYDYKGGDYANSERTEQHDKVVEVNAEAKALEPIYMRYTTSGAGYLFNKPVKGEMSDELYYMLTQLRQTGMKDIDKSVVTDLTVEGNELVQVGQFKKNVGEGTALMLLNITDYLYETKTTAKVTFTTVDPATLVTAYVKGIPTVLDPDENGVYSLDLCGAEAAFLTFE
ncbi:MAG: hypothetical protein IJD10_05355, partial [Clostridia bacterium]|nr:hypothetical protein [Clostridia bacterium]